MGSYHHAPPDREDKEVRILGIPLRGRAKWIALIVLAVLALVVIVLTRP